MKSTGHIAEFVALLRDPLTPPLQLRAALWSLGHIGASDRGAGLIVDVDPSVYDLIVALAEQSPCLSLRGAFCCC